MPASTPQTLYQSKKFRGKMQPAAGGRNPPEASSESPPY